MKRLIRVSVRDLVEHVLRQGDLTSVFDFSPRASGYDGLRAHQKIQKSRPDSYTSEVPVFHRISNEMLTLDIQGRIDGVYRQNGSVVIEEIKTTRRDLESFIARQNPLHWAQVQTYAAIYFLENRVDHILVQLTYCQSETGEVRTFMKSTSGEELSLIFQGLTHRYLEWMERIEEWRRTRDRAIQDSDFPYTCFRDGQSQIIEDVVLTIRDQGQMILQAPTGTGKTIATLFPAVKALVSGRIQKIFYLTARTTGHAIAEKTIGDLNSKGLKIKFVTITAKEKVCFNLDKNCTGEECLFARGYYDRLIEAREALFVQDAFTRDVIVNTARTFEVCPFELSLDLSLWVDCVICDMNYAFDPRVYLKRYFMDNSVDCTFLVDEAHNLVDRSREMFSAQIEKSSFLDLRRSLDNTSEVYQAAGEINRYLFKKKKALGEEVFSWEKDSPQELIPLLKRFLLGVERMVTSHPGSPLNRTLLENIIST